MSYSTPFWTSNDSAAGCIVPREYDGIDSSLDSGSTIPVLWSLCFSSKDINVVLAPEEDWSSDDDPHYRASCDTDITGALSRLEQRMPSLFKIIPSHTHDICKLFYQRLKNSSATHIHLDLSWLLDNEENPADGSWSKYFGKILDGLDEPVTTVREGFSSKLLGLGLSSSWNDACFWSVGAQSAKLIRAHDVELWYVAGAGSIKEMESWRA